MDFTKLQYRLEIACKNTIGKFEVDETNKVARCSFNNTFVEVDTKDEVILNSPTSWARFEAEDIGNIFVESVPKKGQGIWIKSKKIYAEIGGKGRWHISER